MSHIWKWTESGRFNRLDERVLRWLALALVTSCLMACGGSDTAAISEAQTTIGVAGGILHGPDGVVISVPANALTSNITIRAARDGLGAPALPSDWVAASPIYSVTPHIEMFLQPVTVEVPFDSNVLPAGATANGNMGIDIAVAQPGGEWELLPTAQNINHVARSATSHFSYVLAVFRPARFNVQLMSPSSLGRWPQNLPANYVTVPLVTTNTTLTLRTTVLSPANVTPGFFPCLSGSTYSTHTRVLTTPWPTPSYWTLHTDQVLTGTGVIDFQLPVDSSMNGWVKVYAYASCDIDYPIGYSNGAAGNPFSSAVFDVFVDIASGTAAPTIGQQPQAVTVTQGQPANFDVGATASNTLTVAWERSNDAGATWFNVQASGALTGYTLLSTSTADDGAQFRAQVCNVPLSGVANCVTSNAATLTVTAQTANLPVGNTVIALAGDPASFGVYADGSGASAKFYNPRDLAVDSLGNVYVTDTDTVRKVTPAGVVTTLAGAHGFTGAIDGTGAAARFTSLIGITIDATGDLLVTDSHAIRRVTTSGVVTTVAGSVSTAGIRDGAAANALFNTPQALVTDGAGSIYVVDRGNYGLSNFNQDGSVRKIAPDGTVTTLTAAHYLLNLPEGIAMISPGQLVIADTYNDRVLTLGVGGGVPSLLAGQTGVPGHVNGTGAAASFSYTRGVAADNSGAAYVCDEGGGVRRINALAEVNSYYAIDAKKVAVARGPTGATRLFLLAASGFAPAVISIVDP